MSGGNSTKGQQKGLAGRAGLKSGMDLRDFCELVVVVVAEEEAKETGLVVVSAVLRSSSDELAEGSESMHS